MAANKLKLATNVPLKGMLKRLIWFENEFGKSLILTLEVPTDCAGVSMGTYQAGEGTVFVDEDLALPLQQLGCAMETGEKRKDFPVWKVIGAPIIEVLKTEDGKEKHQALTRIDPATGEVTAPQAGGTGPGPAQNGQNQGQPPAGTTSSPPPTQQSPPPGDEPQNGKRTPADMKADTLKDWKRLATAYHKALEISATGMHKALKGALGSVSSTHVIELDQRAVATVANSIMIAADRSGLIPRTYAGIFNNGKAKPKPQEPAGLNPGAEDDDDLPF